MDPENNNWKTKERTTGKKSFGNNSNHHNNNGNTYDPSKRPELPRLEVTQQLLALEALAKLFQKNLPLSEKFIEEDTQLGEATWKQLGQEIMKFLTGIPNVLAPNYQKSVQKMIILCGLPASGKSTFANRLIEHNSHWARVNQDEMKTRKNCEVNAKTAFQRSQSVIVDRCNFDYSQRNVWVKLATKMKCNDIICVSLNFSKDVCKGRIQKRENHPTIRSGDEGVVIIDKFSSQFLPPILCEGFSQVIEVSTEEKFDEVVLALSKINLKDL